jgi:thioesterase domain-containing protein
MGRRSANPRSPVAEREKSAVRKLEGDLEQLRSLWAAVLGHESFALTDSFFNLGGDSFKAFRLLSLMEETFGVSVSPHHFIDNPTLSQLASLLACGLPGFNPSVPEIVAFRTRGSGSPLFLVHPGVGSAESYRRMVELMDLDRPVFGINAPAFSELGGVSGIREIAALYRDAASTMIPSGGKAVFGGYCVGGLIAYEMACQDADRSGQNLPVLMIDVPADSQRGTILQGALDIVRNLPAWLRHDVFHSTPYALMRRGLLRSIRILAPWTSTAITGSGIIHAKLSARQEHTTLTLVAAMRIYAPRSYSGRVALLRAATPSLFAPRDPAMGWGRYATDLRLGVLPGTHDSWLKENNIAAAASLIRSHLAWLEP